MLAAGGRRKLGYASYACYAPEQDHASYVPTPEHRKQNVEVASGFNSKLTHGLRL
jgi:hypothetical protein